MFETPVHPQQVTFARGEVSPFLFGRVDLTAYSAGLRTLRNGFVRPEGAVSNRPGYTFVTNSLINTSKASILVPFIFSATQSYVIEIGNLSSQVTSQGSLVVNGSPVNISNVQDGIVGFQVRRTITCSSPHGLSSGQNVVIGGVVATGTFQVNGTWTVLGIGSPTVFYIQGSGDPRGAYTSGGTVQAVASFVTPWAAGDLPALRWTQSTDTLTVVHPNYPPYEIKRTSATTFTCLPAVYNGGPFLQQNADGVTFVYANLQSGTVTLTATAPIFNANHVGALFKLTQQDLSTILPWEPLTNVDGIVGALLPTCLRRSNLKNYKAVSYVITAAHDATGTIAPSHSQGTQADGQGGGQIINGVANACGINWQYQDSGYGIVKIIAFTDSQHVTAVVQPNYIGGPGLLPYSVIGGPVTAVGPWTFSGDGSTTTFNLTTPNNTSSDPTKFYVTIGGVYQAPSLYSISSAAGGNIVFIAAPPVGIGNVVVKQISALGSTTYWQFGAFSADQGYPGTASYFPDRLVLAGTKGQPVIVCGSQTSDYHNFFQSNPVVASDAFTVFLNTRQLNAISDLLPLSDLIVGTSNIMWRLWPGSTGTALSPLAIASTPQNAYGQNPNCAGLLTGDSAIFPEFDGRRLREMIYQFAYDKFVGQELTLYSRHLIPFGTRFQRLAYKPDAAGQFLIGLRTDGTVLCCTYLREQQVTGWAHWDTAGTVEDICVVPETTQYVLYVLTNRQVNGVQTRMIEKLASREVSTIYDYKYLDCNQTYDGRNTSGVQMEVTGGTTWLAGDTGTITASGSSGWATFLPSDITENNEIWLYDASGARVRCLLTGYTSATVCSVRFRDPCPTDLQGVFTPTWTFARTVLSGASQLANTPIAALVDSNVVGVSQVGFAANGSLVVDPNGLITLPSAGGVVQVGLPYLFDFETLALNVAGQETIRMRAKTNPVIYIDVTETRNFLAGTDFTAQNIKPNVERAFETYVAPTNTQEGITWTRIPSELDSECHTCVRQNFPLPITIRMHIPQVTIGEPVS